ncbi:hypothetical protein CEE36_11305 [candidate division TA06 bacterium B3_TA06]|uniref:Sulfatase-modifying factor enzyme-like domain-containing protein n=1 Tax=candidate division TA06 bacterium B3_TA06 TaxID=2012487 RepID=A0A532UPQ3_UNCT6|nr:MAG: hypothetical protein CEE36_11305 [candidate division TA06 bacterium B3_TA06]
MACLYASYLSPHAPPIQDVDIFCAYILRITKSLSLSKVLHFIIELTNYNPGNYSEDGYSRTSPVGSYPQGVSPYGCMDMAGNVCEWCADWYGANYYSSSPDYNPEGPSSGSSRVKRGGSWYADARLIRCADRSYSPPCCSRLGFRLSMD